MEMRVEHIQSETAVTILSLVGELDASNYLALVEKVAALYQTGSRNLLIDLSELTFMASSGLVAFHRVALIMRGAVDDPNKEGWNPMRAIAHEVKNEADHDNHCKLLNPQPRVAQTLQVTGFDKIMTIYFDRDAAITSFT
ncbi:MAG: STAS domain-containing protein [Anaerolineales bacterium]|nr:STAS domain-containing protein [Anaerolineales bacterium]MCA9927890.1 STAS domain-containing protein [Anaerolineales bacterium]